jgi:hypothetical protein
VNVITVSQEAHGQMDGVAKDTSGQSFNVYNPSDTTFNDAFHTSASTDVRKF